MHQIFLGTPPIELGSKRTSVEKKIFHLCDEILCLHLSYWYANVHYLCRLNGAQVLQEVCQVVMKAFIETKFH